MDALQEHNTPVRGWLPVVSGSSALAIIAAMVWAALLTPPPLPPPASAVLRGEPETATLEGLHLCHGSAATFEACWQATIPRTAGAADRATRLARQGLPKLLIIRIVPFPAAPGDSL